MTGEGQKQFWTMKIRPHERLWHIDLGEIWRYRDLITLFVKRNIIVQYKQIILGPLWYIIQPLILNSYFLLATGGIKIFSSHLEKKYRNYNTGDVRFCKY